LECIEAIEAMSNEQWSN